MTERPASEVARGDNQFHIGPSKLALFGDTLTIDIDEYTAPIPRRIQGRVQVHLPVLARKSYLLTPDGGHRWTPYAPHCAVDVNLKQPDLKWAGHGYLDSNRGDEALEDGIKTWTWSRYHGSRPGAASGQHTAGQMPDTPAAEVATILYDVVPRRVSNPPLRFGLTVMPDGDMTSFDLPHTQRLPTSLWRMRRDVPLSDRSETARIVHTAEDSPFYTRSLMTLANGDQNTLIGMHESLNMDRFRSPLMKAVMPVRMPRQFW